MWRITGWGVLFLCLVQPVSGADFTLAFWNVENLFDTVDDPRVAGDEEFTPSGPKKWTEERLNIKLQNLARAISRMNRGQGPDVLGLAEIENRKVIELLIEHLKPLKRDYKIVHKDSPSGRGIDTALIYDSGKFQLDSEKFHHISHAGNTRDIVEAKLKAGGQALTVFVNHWPSRGNSEETRIAAARTLRKRVDQLYEADPKADFAIIGDLNDFPTNESVKTELRAGDSPSHLKDGDLYDTMWPLLRAGKGSYVYQNEWEVIDHIIVSAGLLDDAGWKWKADSTVAIQSDELIFKPRQGQGIPRPNRSYSGNTFHKTGYSDHLAVSCVLQLAP